MCQHKKTHMYVKPQMIYKQTPTLQHVGWDLLRGSSVSMHDLQSRQILWGRGSDGRIHMQQVPSRNLF